MTYNIVLADDHRLFREGLELIIQQLNDCRVAGSVSNGAEVLQWLEKNSAPDLILMDLQMPDVDGKEALEIIRTKYGQLKVIIVSMYNNPAIVKSLITSGANGYLLKNADSAEFALAIRKVLEGGRYFSSEITEGLANVQATQTPILADVLSERELEVVRLVAAGKSNQQIADQLFISVRTVETHRKNILAKLELGNIAGLIRLACQQGLIK